MEKKRILIVEDHTILREGLKSLLTTNPDIEIVGEAGDGREAIYLVEKLIPGPGNDGSVHAAHGRHGSHSGNQTALA